jgi:Protein of unknown function (DUF2971)
MNVKKLYLYKPFSSLDHLTQLQNYINQKVWFTRLSNFNDPFEGQFHYRQASPTEILKNDNLLQKQYSKNKLKNPETTEKEFKNKLASKEDEQIVIQLQLVTDIFDSHGAICLTESETNIPMWAHYANHHQGYCIIFEMDLDKIYENCKADYSEDFTRNEFNSIARKVFDHKTQDHEIFSFSQPEDDSEKKFIFTKVIYKNNIPIIEEVILEQLKTKSPYEQSIYFAKNAFGVKFEQWNYEEEYRLVVNANSEGCDHSLMDLNGYPFIRISGIILGQKFARNCNQNINEFISHLQLQGYKFECYKLSDRVKEFVINMALDQQLDIYLAECSLNEYRITIKPYEDSKTHMKTEKYTENKITEEV